jgi:DNA-binding Lrp family transcriptional regulator
MVEKFRDIDQFDEKLLCALQRNARAISFELAEIVGLSPSSCQRRQRELEQRGIVQGYRADVDPAVLGQAFTVFAAVQLQRHERSEVQAVQKAAEKMEVSALEEDSTDWALTPAPRPPLIPCSPPAAPPRGSPSHHTPRRRECREPGERLARGAVGEDRG